jgi:hypothetical protein
MGTKDILDGKKRLRSLIADTMEEYSDTGKSSMMSNAEKLCKTMAANGDDATVTKMSADMAVLKANGAELQNYDMSGFIVDNYNEESALLESKIVDFDSKWDEFKRSLEHADKTLADRKKDVGLQTRAEPSRATHP